MPSSSEFIKGFNPKYSDFQVPGSSWDHNINDLPILPDSFYERNFTYHDAEPSFWAVAHNTSSGPGIASQVLARKFQHVNVCDAELQFVEIAEETLKNIDFLERKFTSDVEEAVKSSVASYSVDLLVISEAIRWCGISTAIK